MTTVKVGTPASGASEDADAPGVTVRVGIVGSTGYLGTELLRHLLTHPNATVTTLASATRAGKPAASSFPQFGKRIAHTFTPLAPEALAGCDMVFLATPSGVARELAPKL